MVSLTKWKRRPQQNKKYNAYGFDEPTDHRRLFFNKWEATLYLDVIKGKQTSCLGLVTERKTNQHWW